MKCEEAREHLSVYLDDMLEQDLRIRLEDHLSKCEACTEELNELKSVIDSVSSLDQVKAPSDFLDSVKKKLEPRLSLGKIVKMLLFPLQIKIPIQAAAVAVSVLLVFALVQQLHRSTDEFPRPMAPKPLKVAKTSGKEGPLEKAEAVDGRRVLGEQDRDRGIPSTPKPYDGEKVALDKEIMESEKSMKASGKSKKEMEPQQLRQEKEENRLNDLALKTRAPGRVPLEKRAFEDPARRLESEPQSEAKGQLHAKTQDPLDIKDLKKELIVKPIELVIFIDEARQVSTEGMAMKRPGRVEETAAGGRAEKEVTSLAGQRSLMEAEIKEKSLENQTSNQARQPGQEVSILATEGIMAEIQQMVFESSGKVINSIQNSQPGTPSLIRTEIPKKSYHDFCNKLKTLSPQTICPSFDSVPDQGMIPVDIKIIQK